MTAKRKSPSRSKAKGAAGSPPASGSDRESKLTPAVVNEQAAAPAEQPESDGAPAGTATRPDAGQAPEPRAASAEEPTREEGQPVRFPVVGIGASAGGLEAVVELLQNLPSDLQMALIFVQHLDPRYRSNLVEILARSVNIPVHEAADGIPVEKGCLYVIPADRDLAVMHGKVQLMSRPEGLARHLPIDFFFRSLAEDQGANAVGVILSGTGSDGASGLRAIKAESGITMVQEPSEAKYNGMPAAAVATGHVDLVLPAKRIAEELARISKRPRAGRTAVDRRDAPAGAEQQDLEKVFMLVRRATGVDFSLYKRTSVERRLSRRMLLHRIESLKTYVKYLQQNSAEVSALFEDLLINVTSFFREPTAFQALKETAFPRILAVQPADAPIRIWVPACSTGEEAYSIAITLLESLGDDSSRRPIQVFATDVSPTSIEKARLGNYPENIAGEVSAERLQKYFVKTDNGYQVRKTIRDLCVFAIQNLAKDPPFSRLDLISCRNVLIYMDAPLQKRIIPVFHYALRSHGFLLLGASETVGDFVDLFTLIERKQKLYARKPGAARVPIEFSPIESGAAEIQAKGETIAVSRPLDLDKEVTRIISHRFGPNGVLINQHMEIERFFGQTGRFIEPTPGVASLSLLKIVRPNLGADVRTMIQTAKTQNKPVRKEGLRMRHNGSLMMITVEVIPVGASHFLLAFEESPPAGAIAAKGKTAGRPASRETQEENEVLRAELATTKENLQAIIEEHEATNEELRAANEEIQSSNEELQSTNEEMTTAKEELQSTNEELTTLNEELENRNAELRQALSDLNNLLASVSIPLLILDNDLCIRCFAPPSESIFRLIPSDCGRPIGELRLGLQHLDMEKLERDVRQVIRTLDVYEEQVQTQDGHWYAMRIRPYRTSDDRINGAVVALFDVTERRQTEAQLRNSRRFAENLLATVHEPVLVMDQEFRVISANTAFYETFQVTPRHTEGHPVFQLGNGQWDIPSLRSLLTEILAKESRAHDCRMELDLSGVGHKTLLVNASRFDQDGEPAQVIVVTFQEVADERAS